MLAMPDDDCFDIAADCTSIDNDDCWSPYTKERCKKACHLCGECKDHRSICFSITKEECNRINLRLCRKTCARC